MTGLSAVAATLISEWASITDEMLNGLPTSSPSVKSSATVPPGAPLGRMGWVRQGGEGYPQNGRGRRLRQAGVTRVYGGSFCTFSDPERFYSHRRDGVSGRMATIIWRD